jgi:hypothetical protein
VHLAYQAAGHELSAKTFDYSPSSIRDRWAAGQSDMAHGLALLHEAEDDARRFKHLAADPDGNDLSLRPVRPSSCGAPGCPPGMSSRRKAHG